MWFYIDWTLECCLEIFLLFIQMAFGKLFVSNLRGVKVVTREAFYTRNSLKGSVTPLVTPRVQGLIKKGQYQTWLDWCQKNITFIRYKVAIGSGISLLTCVHSNSYWLKALLLIQVNKFYVCIVKMSSYDEGINIVTLN